MEAAHLRTDLRSPPKRRWLRATLGILTVVVLGVPALIAWMQWSGVQALERAIAEVESLDPAWRLEDIEAKREFIPPAGNSALEIIAICDILPSIFDGGPADGIVDSHPQHALSATQLASLRKKLASPPEALARARKLKDYPRGRFPVTYSPDYISTPITEQSGCRRVYELLALDSQVLAAEGRCDEALLSCQSLYNAFRTLRDEPFMICQLVRAAGRRRLVDALERAVAQGQPSPNSLRIMQQLLEQEETEPLLLISMRGERAGLDRWIQFHFFGDQFFPSRVSFKLPGAVERERAEVLRHMTDVLEAAKLPPLQRRETIRHIAAERREANLGAFGKVVPAYAMVEQVFQQSHALLRATIAALAAERYRREKGHWPSGLEALLAAAFLKSVPTDPLDGKPLHWRRYEDRLVIYSLGADDRDYQGTIISRNVREIGDIGVRLWNVESRCQPPS